MEKAAEQLQAVGISSSGDGGGVREGQADPSGIQFTLFKMQAVLFHLENVGIRF